MRSLIQHHRALWNSPARRLLLLKWALCLAMLSGLALSPRLWLADRDYPSIPILDGLPSLSPSLTLVLFGALILCTLLTAILPRPGWALWGLLGSGLLLACFDVNRLQPWFYQYALMFLSLGLVRWDNPEARESKAALGICGLILAALYFWSGIQKMNMSFVEQVFPFLANPLGDELIERWKPMAYAAPFVESLLGLLLFLPRTRLWGLIGATAMHAFLLIALGPLGVNYNTVIWPWNFWMPFFGFILFFRNPNPLFPAAWETWIGKAVTVLVAAFPLLNFFGRWDNYLSASLYSGRSQSAWVYLTEEGAKRFIEIYPDSQKTLLYRKEAPITLDVSQWAMNDMNIPPYPEVRAYLAVTRKLKEAGIRREDMTLSINEKPNWRDRKYTFKWHEIP